MRIICWSSGDTRQRLQHPGHERQRQWTDLLGGRGSGNGHLQASLSGRVTGSSGCSSPINVTRLTAMTRVRAQSLAIFRTELQLLRMNKRLGIDIAALIFLVITGIQLGDEGAADGRVDVAG